MGGELDLERLEPSQPAPAPQDPPSFWKRFQEHKMLQWTLAYAGAALAIAHGQELMASAFGWPHAVGRVVMALLVLGVPLVATLAWYHGHKGLQRVGAGELLIVSVLLVILAGGFVVLVHAPEGEHSSAGHATEAAAAASAPLPDAVRPPPAMPRIAVMPFTNLSPDPADAFFTDGMHEQILSTLANRAAGLEVISRTTMMSYRGRPVTVHELVEALGATHVLEGSVRREQNQMRLTVQLVDARADRNVWSQDYNRTLSNALTVQSEVAAEVALRLSAQLAVGATGPAAASTRDPEAYDLYLKARLGYPGIAEPASRFEEMLGLLDAAISRDPAFVGAYLERMRLNRAMFIGSHDATERRLELVHTDLATVTRLAPADPAVLYAQAVWSCLLEQFDEALEQFERARTAGFNGSEPDRAVCLGTIGRYDEERTLLEDAIALDPRNPLLLLVYASNAINANRPFDAMRAINLGMSRLPSYAVWPSFAASVRFYFTGGDERWLELVDRRVRVGTGPMPLVDEDSNLRVAVDTLRLERRYADAGRLLEGAPELIRWSDETVRAVGRTPTAHFRGWIDLLLEDEQAAAADGRALLEFAGRQEVTSWNRVHLRLLEAEGRLFSGDRERAREAARDVVATTSTSRNAWRRVGAHSMAASVLAWADAGDEAVTLLETLATSSPGLPAARITRDPKFSVPLAASARYRALSERLEAQMATLDLE